MTLHDSRIYAIIDVDACVEHRFDVSTFAHAVCCARPCCVQLRAKRLDPMETLGLLRELVHLARPLGIPVYANDRPDLAQLANADGVHLGQLDMPAAQVRKVAPRLRVGMSTHDAAQLRSALSLAPDYVAFGPVYPTLSKHSADPAVGIAGLAEAGYVAQKRRVPLVAVGGINAERMASVLRHASLCAIIGALFPASNRIDDVTDHLRSLCALSASLR